MKNFIENIDYKVDEQFFNMATLESRQFSTMWEGGDTEVNRFEALRYYYDREIMWKLGEIENPFEEYPIASLDDILNGVKGVVFNLELYAIITLEDGSHEYILLIGEEKEICEENLQKVIDYEQQLLCALTEK